MFTLVYVSLIIYWASPWGHTIIERDLEFNEIETVACSGQCCESIALPDISYEHFFNAGADPANENIGREDWGDIQFIINNFEPAFLHDDEDLDTLKSYITYRCTMYNADTKKCMDYDSRPDVCRFYPYGRKCKIQGCTRKVREG